MFGVRVRGYNKNVSLNYGKIGFGQFSRSKETKTQISSGRATERALFGVAWELYRGGALVTISGENSIRGSDAGCCFNLLYCYYFVFNKETNLKLTRSFEQNLRVS